MRAEAAARAAFPARRQSAAPRARRGTDGGERRREAAPRRCAGRAGTPALRGGCRSNAASAQECGSRPGRAAGTGGSCCSRCCCCCERGAGPSRRTPRQVRGRPRGERAALRADGARGSEALQCNATQRNAMRRTALPADRARGDGLRAAPKLGRAPCGRARHRGERLRGAASPSRKLRRRVCLKERPRGTPLRRGLRARSASRCFTEGGFQPCGAARGRRCGLCWAERPRGAGTGRAKGEGRSGCEGLKCGAEMRRCSGPGRMVGLGALRHGSEGQKRRMQLCGVPGERLSDRRWRRGATGGAVRSSVQAMRLRQ